jgi:hypothetical protein
MMWLMQAKQQEDLALYFRRRDGCCGSSRLNSIPNPKPIIFTGSIASCR